MKKGKKKERDKEGEKNRGKRKERKISVRKCETVMIKSIDLVFYTKTGQNQISALL